MTSPKKDRGGNLLAMALAGAVGAALGILFAPKAGDEIRQDIADKANQMVKKFKESRADIQNILKETFGEFNEDLERSYVDMRANILALMEDAEEKSQKAYNEIVDETVDNFSKEEGWASNISRKLKENFRRHWDDLKE